MINYTDRDEPIYCPECEISYDGETCYLCIAQKHNPMTAKDVLYDMLVEMGIF